MAGVYFFMRFYLPNVRGYGPLRAELLTMPVGWFGAKAVTSCGLLLVVDALMGYRSPSLQTPIAAREMIFLLLGAGMGIVMPTATESVMSIVEEMAEP